MKLQLLVTEWVCTGLAVMFKKTSLDPSLDNLFLNEEKFKLSSSIVDVTKYIEENFGRNEERVRFAALINNKPSKIKLNYQGYEINKDEAPAWVVFPWEEWDK